MSVQAAVAQDSRAAGRDRGIVGQAPRCEADDGQRGGLSLQLGGMSKMRGSWVSEDDGRATGSTGMDMAGSGRHRRRELGRPELE